MFVFTLIKRSSVYGEFSFLFYFRRTFEYEDVTSPAISQPKSNRNKSQNDVFSGGPGISQKSEALFDVERNHVRRLFLILRSHSVAGNFQRLLRNDGRERDGLLGRPPRDPL